MASQRPGQLLLFARPAATETTFETATRPVYLTSAATRRANESIGLLLAVGRWHLQFGTKDFPRCYMIMVSIARNKRVYFVNVVIESHSCPIVKIHRTMACNVPGNVRRAYSHV